VYDDDERRGEEEKKGAVYCTVYDGTCTVLHCVSSGKKDVR
jgi:hypothetical protein